MHNSEMHTVLNWHFLPFPVALLPSPDAQPGIRSSVVLCAHASPMIASPPPQANSNPTVDIVLRYAAFTAVWIAQIKDEYWNPYYTALVVVAFCIMPVCKFCGAMRLPPYNSEKLFKGFVAGVASAVCFIVGLDDQVDPFRLFHGLSQALVGLALYFLWQLVPLHEDEKKTDDPIDSKLVRESLVVPGMGARAMSGHDLPLCTQHLARLEYY